MEQCYYHRPGVLIIHSSVLTFVPFKSLTVIWNATWMQIMDYASLPHFCKREGSGSSRHSRNGMIDNCFSVDHPFHQELYNYVKQQSNPTPPLKQGSFHVAFPEPDANDARIAKTIESEFHRLEDQKDQNGLVRSLSKQLSDLDIKINWYREHPEGVSLSFWSSVF